MINNVHKLWRDCARVQASFFLVTVRYILHRLKGKNLIISNRVDIRGLQRVQIDGLLRVGLSYVGFMGVTTVRYSE